MLKEFPLLEVEVKGKSKYKDLGFAIGERHRERIQRRIESRRVLIPKYRSYLKKMELYLAITKRYFPHLIEEVEGIALGAQVPFIEYFFAQAREVYPFYIDGDGGGGGTVDHCTVVVNFNEDGPIIGHNEDWSEIALDDLYLLKAIIDGVTIFGLQYAVSLAGEAASINSHGLIQCVTEIHPIATLGVPKNFVGRAILEAKTLDEALRIIANTPMASGYNHVLVQGDEIRNVEIAGKQHIVQAVKGKPFVHTNHFTAEELEKFEKFRTPSSVARYNRAQELNVPELSLDRMKQLLSDQAGELPICRPHETIGSLIFQPQRGIVSVSYGMTNPDNFVEYKI